MTKEIYLYRDAVANDYEFFGLFVNDNVAMREFDRACVDPKVPSEDLELYLAAELDTSSGKIIRRDDMPVFLKRGEKHVSHDV